MIVHNLLVFIFIYYIYKSAAMKLNKKHYIEKKKCLFYLLQIKCYDKCTVY
jgi:hypothetical protein